MHSLLALLVTAALSADPITADVLIKNGSIYDGSGSPPYIGDVAIKGDRIVAIGKTEGITATETVDATGLIICPGFIDLHNHSDTPIVSEKSRSAINYLRQGCTTLVTGNCGGGNVDVATYFKKLEEQPPGVNIIHLMPHGSIRNRVFGDRDRPPTAEELDKMRALVDKGMRDGAWGISTGLIYVPGTYAKTDEIIELAKVVAQHRGIYASHMRNESTKLLDSVEETLRIGRESGCPVHISHMKASGPDAWGLAEHMITRVNQARAQGQIVTGDQYPYTASSTGLEPTIVPSWAREGGHEQLVKRLDDPTTGPELKQQIARELALRGGGQRIVIASAPKHSQLVGHNLLEAAEIAHQPLIDVITDLIRDGHIQIINFGMSEKDMHRIMTEPFVATASDGSARMPSAEKPHPRSYGTFPAKIGRYAYREHWLPVEQAIRSATGLPADILHLPSRGYLRPGYAADLAILDLDHFIDTATYDKPHQYATGVKRLYVNGQLAVKDDKFTGNLAGRPLRHTE